MALENAGPPANPDPASVTDPNVEKAPRAGILPSDKAKTVSAKPKAKVALPSGPPLELPASTPPPAAAPAPASPILSVSVAPEVCVPAGPPARSSVSKKNAKRLAFLYSAESEARMKAFTAFLDELAGKGKNPFSIDRVLVHAVQGTEEPGTLVSAVRGSEAAGTVALLAPLSPGWRTALADRFQAEGMFLRDIVADEAGLHSAAVDLLVELVLFLGS